MSGGFPRPLTAVVHSQKPRGTVASSLGSPVWDLWPRPPNAWCPFEEGDGDPRSDSRRRLRNCLLRGRGPAGRVDHCTTVPPRRPPTLLPCIHKHCSTFLGFTGVLRHDPSRFSYHWPQQGEAKARRTERCSPARGELVVTSPALSELILAVVGYGPPPPTASALIRLAPRALVGYSPIRLALMALASEPPRPTRARRSVGDTPQGGH